MRLHGHELGDGLNLVNLTGNESAQNGADRLLVAIDCLTHTHLLLNAVAIAGMVTGPVSRGFAFSARLAPSTAYRSASIR
jgi:hypothetical protein